MADDSTVYSEVLGNFKRTHDAARDLSYSGTLASFGQMMTGASQARAGIATANAATAEGRANANFAYRQDALNAGAYNLTAQDYAILGAVQRMRGQRAVGVPQAQAEAAGQADMAQVPVAPGPVYAPVGRRTLFGRRV
jgi:hypothetical protein